MIKRPRILFLDIETFPNEGYTWGKYEQTVIQFIRETCLATYAAKWLGEKEVFAKALCDYKGYRAGSYDDSKLVADLWALVNEADIIVAHNGDQFDIKVFQARFIFHKLSPPKPFKTVDTKKAVKKVARFNSNKLDDLSTLLENEKKIKTDFELWRGCINGDRASWALMVKYNKKDILLLEKLYLRLRPWITNHPNFMVLEGKLNRVCPKCGSKRLTYQGFAITQSRRYRRLKCMECGGWAREVKCEDSAKTVNG
jgi:hypothetical protein